MGGQSGAGLESAGWEVGRPGGPGRGRWAGLVGDGRARSPGG